MEFQIISNIGSRQLNEDFADGFISEENKVQQGFFILADGLGGHGKGDIASHYVVNEGITFGRALIGKDHLIEKTIEHVQEGLLDLQKKENAKSKMKTTIIILQIEEDKIQWGHVGDSRLYFFHNNKLISRTLDHSVPQMLALAGDIKDKDIRSHADRNKLLRVVGTEWDEPKYEISDVIKRTGREFFLLCTDGFWELITEKEMLKCLKKSKNVNQWLELMGKIVQKNGKNKDMDNWTALAVSMS